MQKENSHTNTTDLSAALVLVDRSVLLTDEQKSRVRAYAESASADDLKRISEVLMTESSVVQSIVNTTVQTAAKNQEGPAVARKLDEFFRQAGRFLNQSHEHAERANESAGLESLFEGA